jgi:ubiquinone biosynthesis protein UbiJ
MRPALHEMLAPAAIERLTLLINHVLGREPVAMERLRPHAGRVLLLQAEGWPALLPPWPVLAFRVTPAGLLEWCGQDAPPTPDLQVRLDASNPALLVLGALSGRQPAVHVEGDARLAGDVNWLLENLRWDLADDLQRLLGPAPAQLLAQAGPAIQKALAQLAPLASGLVSRCAAAFSGGAPGAAGGPFTSPRP